MTVLEVQAPQLHIRAAVRPDSYSESAHTVEVVFSTGAPKLVRDRYGEFGGDYMEVLGLEEGMVRLDRFNSGLAPVLDSHGTTDHREGGPGLDDTIGVVSRGWLEDGKGVLTAQFSQRKPVKERDLETDVKAGVLGSWSIGYRVYRYRDITTPDDPMRVLLAIDWEPIEVSLLPVPEDPGVHTRGAENRNLCVIEDAEPAEIPMTKKKTTPKAGGAPANTPPTGGGQQTRGAGEQTPPTVEGDGEGDGDGVTPPVTEGARGAGGTPTPTTEPPAGGEQRQPVDVPVAEQVRTAMAEERQNERQRVIAIREAFRSGYLGEGNDPEVLIDEHVDKGTSAAEVNTIALTMIRKAQEGPTPTMTSGLHTGLEEPEKQVAGMVNALSVRTGLQTGKGADRAPVELTDAGRPFYGMSLIRMAEHVLTMKGERGATGMAPDQLAIRALGTGDFPDILANVANKSLQAAYEDNRRTFTAWARRTEVADFKPKRTVQLGGLALQELGHNGEIRVGSIGDKSESWTLATYAIRLPFTRQTIVNDDQDAFSRVPMLLGAAAARTESDIVYQLLTSNPTLNEDATALFDATHGNTATDTLDKTGLSNGPRRDAQADRPRWSAHQRRNPAG